MSNMADGLNFAPRVKEPESALEPGMAAPAPGKAVERAVQLGLFSMPDTSIGAVALQEPPSWVYDFDPGTGSARATFNGEVSFVSGGSGTAGVTTWNTRSGAVVLTTADITGAGGAPVASPAFSGSPTAPTQVAADSSTKLANTAWVSSNALMVTGGTVTGNVTLSGATAIKGTTTNDNAAAGNVGEYIEATGSTTGLTTGTALNTASITLTAGDWDVEGFTQFSGAASTTVSNLYTSLSTTAGSLDATMGRLAVSIFAPASAQFGGGNQPTQSAGEARFSLSATTTIYLVVMANFATSTCSLNASRIRARRVR